MQPILKSTEVEINGPSDAIKSVSSAVARFDLKSSTQDVKALVSLQPVDSSGNAVKDVSVTPNSIQVTVPVKKIKNVPINLKIQGNLSSEGNIKSIIPAPNTIDIAGDEKVVSNVNALDTENIDVSKLYNKDTAEVKVIIPQGVTLINSNGTVKLKINLDKTVQKDFNLNIQTKNLGNNYAVSLDIDKVSITVSGPEDAINNLKLESIECYIDLNSLSEGEQVANVIVNLPSGISKVVQNPSTVKAVITKKVLEGKNVNQNK
ncbi:CdaR family protein [Clostridium sp. OS1-26]|uniref:CdaR family protein n=1 Tax=Clostridium sp. OS1-26 TaxID=3070681 RepID=UPI0027DF314D|nr:CdaR family protein [Clostridium sp. OS1-26]WML36218.1 CdaR family protein [Clostridium sp. OS1-26]